MFLAFTAACHSEPAEPAFYGATGTLTVGAEVRLTYADTNEDGVKFRATAPTWASDGKGIMFSFLPRPYGPGEKKLGQRCFLSRTCRAVAQDPGDKCLAMLPPTGGSAYWNVCESRSGHSNVIDRIEAGDVNSAGQLLYTEEAGPASQQFVPDGPPGDYADLWLSTVTSPVIRRELCRFFGTGIVLPAAAPCSVGILRNIQWSGPNTFVAMSGSGLIRGAVTSDSVSISAMGTPTSVVSYALVDNHSAVIIVGGDFRVRRVAIADGTVTVVGTLPLPPDAVVRDVGCHPDLCVVLVASGSTPRHWDLWRMDRVTGNAAVVRTFDHELITAKLSPTSGDVVALEPVGADTSMYLLTKVIP